MVATNHMWLFKYKFNILKLNVIKIPVPWSHEPHLKCSAAIAKILDDTKYFRHHRKFYWTEHYSRFPSFKERPNVFILSFQQMPRLLSSRLYTFRAPQTSFQGCVWAEQTSWFWTKWTVDASVRGHHRCPTGMSLREHWSAERPEESGKPAELSLLPEDKSRVGTRQWSNSGSVFKIQRYGMVIYQMTSQSTVDHIYDRNPIRL